MTTHSLRLAIRVLVAAALLLTSPGLSAYAAIAKTLGPTVEPHGVPGQPIQHAASLSANQAAIPPLSGSGLQSAPATPLLPEITGSRDLTGSSVERALQPAQARVNTALKTTGNIDSAAPADLHGLGAKLEKALTGELSAPTDGDVTATAGPSNQRAPLAVSGESSRSPSTQDPSVPPPSDPTPPSPKAPFWPKLVAAGVALAPLYYFGLPLLAAGSTILGGLTVAASLSLAVMPFLSESSPRLLRAAPGAFLVAFGAAALAAGVAWPSVFALLGGWGLMRYGLGKSRIPGYKTLESLSAYFGGIAAVAGTALAALSPAGWLAAALPWATYPVSALLWLHLPSWISTGVLTSLRSLYNGAEGLSRPLTALPRDTIAIDRLDVFSTRYWKQSKWNGIWIAVIWTPIVLIEIAKFLLALVAGLYAGAIQAPGMFLWGAAYKVFKESRTTVYFAEAARLAFDNVQDGKAARFNPIEAKLLPLANSPALTRSIFGAVALSLLQVGWIAYATLAVPALVLAGFLLAFGRMNRPYDAARHSPSSLRAHHNDSPGEKPDTPNYPNPTPGKEPLAPKLIASALALLPAVYFGGPLLASLPLSTLYLSVVLPLAAMPFMRASTPLMVKAWAGYALMLNGALLLDTGSSLMGLIALFGGWGFERYVTETSKTEPDHFDDAERFGAFFGALGSAVGLGAALAGTAGNLGLAALALAAATSPLLLAHLPKWISAAIRGAFKDFPASVRSFHRGLSFWSADTKFLEHLGLHATYWLQKTYWNGVWLSVIWVPIGLTIIAEAIAATALGLLFGLVRAPFGALAEALRQAFPKNEATPFLRRLIEGWRAAAEASEETTFKRMLAPLIPLMNEMVPTNGRPTLKAAGAFAVARLVQIAWLIGVLLMAVSGAAFVYGLVFAWKNRAPAP